MKNNLKGMKDIFTFTVVQNLKSKSMKIATLVLCIIALLSFPIISLISDSDKESKKSTSIKLVKVVDMTGLDLTNSLTEFAKDSGEDTIYGQLEYEVADIDYESLSEESEMKDIYKFDDESNYVYMQITNYEGMFDTQIIYSNKSKVDSDDAIDYSDYIKKNFKNILLKGMNLTEEQKQVIDSEVSIKYQRDGQVAEDVQNSDNTEQNQAAVEGQNSDNAKQEKDNTGAIKNSIIYAALMVIMFALAFGGERIAMSIITEKASKVMEYLMTSVKPMAVVIGKIFANLVVLFIQFGLVIISFIISIVIDNVMNSGDSNAFSLPSYLTKIFSMDNFSGLNAGTLIIAIVILIAGFLFYGMVAGLCGASVSKLDEVTEGIKMYTMLLIIGAYISIFIVTSEVYEGTSVVRLAALLVPITSVFITPAALLTGYVSLVEALLSMVIMVAAVILITRFVANVYESMIYYSGNHLKLKDIITISKQNKVKSSKEGQ